MKKILFTMMIFCLFSLSVYAAETEITIPDSGGAYGEQITVDVNISDNNIAAGFMIIQYDPELLKPVSLTAGAALNNVTADSNIGFDSNAIKLIWMNLEIAIGSGNLAEIKFDVISDKACITSIAVEELKIRNPENKEVSAEITCGKLYLNYLGADVQGCETGYFDGDFDINICGVNTKSDPATICVYVAQYNGGKLLKAESYVYSDVSGFVKETKTVNADKKANVIKILSWNNNMKPYMINKTLIKSK